MSGVRALTALPEEPSSQNQYSVAVTAVRGHPTHSYGSYGCDLTGHKAYITITPHRSFTHTQSKNKSFKDYMAQGVKNKFEKSYYNEMIF